MLSILLIVLLTTISTVLSSSYANIINTNYMNLNRQITNVLSLSKKIEVNIAQQTSVMQEYYSTTDPARLHRFEELSEQLPVLMTEIEQFVETEEGKAELNTLNVLVDRYADAMDNVVAMLRTDLQESERMFRHNVIPTSSVVINQSGTFTAVESEQLENLALQLDTNTTNMLIMIAIVCASLVFIAIILGYYVAHSVSKPIEKISLVTKNVAAGDLSVGSITIKNRDEIGELADSVNTMIANLSNLIQNINTNTLNVASYTEQLSMSSKESKQVSENISSVIQDVAVGMEKSVNFVDNGILAIEEMNDSVSDITNHAEKASGLVSSASSLSSDGNTSITSVINQMESINQTINQTAQMIKELEQQSKDIQKFVSVISEISAQTNLLSLNASIEAARAGEHGRGFAVVADEVKKLSAQSAESANQIQQVASIIQTKVYQVFESMQEGLQEVVLGTEVVNSAGETFNKISSAVQDVDRQIQSVTQSSANLNMGFKHVLNAIKSIEDVTKQTSSGAQNISAATEEQLASMQEMGSSVDYLAKGSESLEDSIRQFKI